MAVSFALVHHANQFLITDGYETREGICDIVGSEKDHTGMLGLLALHKSHHVPFNLHISGTLLEAAAWHCPWAIPAFKEAIHSGLVELVGSCYGQNIMRFFSPEYNVQQINEELRLFEILLDVDPSKVKVFWPPERVWETRSMSPILRDPQLLNGGYDYVLLDDRTLLSTADPDLSRSTYDKHSQWTPELYQAHEIENGMGLVALPIGIRLRQSIPPKKRQDWQQVQSEIEALLVQAASPGQASFVALYADDMEKVSGVWNEDGPERYAAFIEWLSKNEWIRPVKLAGWSAENPPATRRPIEVGTFEELAREFEAGEGYEKWFHSKEWAPYREYFERSMQAVEQAKTAAGGSNLIDLAEKQLLVSNWETAWHTPRSGAHGDPKSSGKPSPWARALTSHCRHALVTAEAACWTAERDRRAHAEIRDVDLDGEPDVILKNDRVFALITAKWGGRLATLFHLGAERDVMVIGNPCDDWNFLEDLNKFMKKPRNHPGAFADVGFENDQYACEVSEDANGVLAWMMNVQKGSRARGMEKIYRLDAWSEALTVQYRLPEHLKHISIECALSPDYLTLLRNGSEIMTPMESQNGHGFSVPGLSVLIEHSEGLRWEKPLQEWIGHGRVLRLSSDRREFTLTLCIRPASGSFTHSHQYDALRRYS